LSPGRPWERRIRPCFFVHRSCTLELEDGNPLNEVRMLAASILQNEGVLASDKTIKLDAQRSILKLKIGDAIRLTEADFARFSRAFLAEVEAKFVASPRARGRGRSEIDRVEADRPPGPSYRL
jgi:hypothetical protein